MNHAQHNARTLERIVSLGLVDLLHQFDLDRLENDTANKGGVA